MRGGREASVPLTCSLTMRLLADFFNVVLPRRLFTPKFNDDPDFGNCSMAEAEDNTDADPNEVEAGVDEGTLILFSERLFFLFLQCFCWGSIR